MNEEFREAMAAAYKGYPEHLICILNSPSKELTIKNRKAIAAFLYLLFEQFGPAQ